MIRVSKKDFDLFIRDNNPEVFNQEAISNWISDIKETLQKSELDELNDIEKGEIDNFKEEINSFTPVEVISPNDDSLQKGLKYETFFIREQQVEWDKVEKGLNDDIEKARSGVYKDTALNRKMGRVGSKFGGKKEAVEEGKDKKEGGDDIFGSKEGNLKTKDGENLTFRVYSDGGVKIEGSNMKKEFKNVNDAVKYIKSEGIENKKGDNKDK
jgi:hypothetical protein